jgi:hypothetical protein
MKRCWVLSKAFSVSIEMSMCFLAFLLLICCIIFNDLCRLKHPWIPVMKSTWSLCMIFWICCWIQFGNILLRIFASTFTKKIDLQFSLSLFLLSCPCQVYRWV